MCARCRRIGYYLGRSENSWRVRARPPSVGIDFFSSRRDPRPYEDSFLGRETSRELKKAKVKVASEGTK